MALEEAIFGDNRLAFFFFRPYPATLLNGDFYAEVGLIVEEYGARGIRLPVSHVPNSKQAGLPAIDSTYLEVPPSTESLVPPKFSTKYRISICNEVLETTS